MSNDSTALAPRETDQLAPTQDMQTDAAMVRARAEIEVMREQAIRFPRSMEDVHTRLMKECKRTRFAESAMYRRPVGGGKVAEGLSIRFAEAAHRNLGNMMVTTNLISDGDELQVWRVSVVDLETNAIEIEDVPVPKYVERRQIKQGDEVLGSRQNSQGITTYKIRADESKLVPKAKAEARKAKRRGVLSLLPADIQEDAIRQIKETLQADVEQDPTAARKKLVGAFADIGVSAADLGTYLGHDLGGASPGELAELRVIYQTVKDGEATWRECLATKTGVEADRKSDPQAGLKKKILDKVAEQSGGKQRKRKSKTAPKAKASQPETTDATPTEYDEEPPPGALASDAREPGED